MVKHTTTAASVNMFVNIASSTSLIPTVNCFSLLHKLPSSYPVHNENAYTVYCSALHFTGTVAYYPLLSSSDPTVSVACTNNQAFTQQFCRHKASHTHNQLNISMENEVNFVLVCNIEYSWSVGVESDAATIAGIAPVARRS